MEQDLWQRCQGEKRLTTLHCNAWRVVEAQHISATRKLVDSDLEHDILENLIENVKPVLPKDPEFVGLHYLLFTPFRYPPLPFGSRFGKHFEPGLWYGSLTLTTALAEVAFYQLYFIQGCEQSLGIIECPLTAFETEIASDLAIDLTKPLFSSHSELISSPTHYQHSQKLGSDMRHHGVEAFLYYSARSNDKAINMGLFTPKAFKKKKPKSKMQTWRCTTQHKTVEFTRYDSIKVDKKIFYIENFYINGIFPLPPN